jgi:hypothetical protein
MVVVPTVMDPADAEIVHVPPRAQVCPLTVVDVAGVPVSWLYAMERPDIARLPSVPALLESR